MRHAAAENVLMLKMATSASQLLHNSHTFAAQPAAVGMSRNDSPLVAGTESQADGPARCSRCWTLVSVTPFLGGQHRVDTQHATPSLGAKGAISEPARSQPG